MQSNVTVPVGGSKFKLWLILVVIAVVVLGGVGYGYYTWQKANEPPPSLEPVDGSGLQGLMKIQDGAKEIQGFAKLEEKDVKECPGGVVELKGETTDYLYSQTEATFKDFYDSITIKENIGKMFEFTFYSPGEKVGATEYKAGFYFFPTSGTNWKAVANVEEKDLASYKIPAYRSVILFHGDAIGICRSGKVGPAVKVDKLSDADVASLEANLKPLPKGWVLVPFGWNLDDVMTTKNELGDFIGPMWLRAGGGDAIKVKEENEDSLSVAVDSSKTRSVWMKTKKVTDLFEAFSADEKEGEDGAVAKKKKGESCEFGGQCEGELGCVGTEQGSHCWEANSAEAVCSVCKDPSKCKIVDLVDDPVEVLCDPSLVGEICESDEICDEGLKCTDVPKEYQEVVGGAKVCLAPKGGDCKLSLDCTPGLVCAKDTKTEIGKCVQSSCDLCGGDDCKNNGEDEGFVSVTCGEINEDFVDKEAPVVNIAEIFAYPDEDWVVDISMSEAVVLPEGKDFVTFCLLKEGTEKTCDGDAVKFISLEYNAVTHVAINGTFDSSSVELGKTYLVVVSDEVTDKAGNPVSSDKNFATVKIPEADDAGKCTVPGDVNGDGEVDCEVDAAAIADIINSKIPSTPCADVNSDGVVNVQDIEKFVMGFCPPVSKEICDNDGVDDDGDKLFDCGDPDCFGKTDKDGFVCCNNGTGDGDNSLCLNGSFCDGGGNSGTFRCIGCEVDSDCKGEGEACVNSFCKKTAIAEVCNNGTDDDEDGKKNCLDEDCLGFEGCVGECKVDADCLPKGGQCVSVDGGAAQCMFTESFSSACPDNPNYVVDYGKQPVLIDCTPAFQ